MRYKFNSFAHSSIFAMANLICICLVICTNKYFEGSYIFGIVEFRSSISCVDYFLLYHARSCLSLIVFVFLLVINTTSIENGAKTRH